MRHLTLLTFLLVLPLLAFKPAEAREEGIAAVVNEDAVTISELNDRMRLITVSSGLPQNDEMHSRVRPQIMSMLIEETIKVQEARRNDIEVSSEEIEKGFAAIAGQNNMTPDQFRAVLAKGNIPERTIEGQIRAQIAWSRLVQSKLRPQIIVNEADVQARIEQLKTNLGKTEYFIGEIFLPVDQATPESEVKPLASRLVQEIREGRAPFAAVAQQFSQSAGAGKGGDIGWVQLNQLPAEVAEALAKMKEGQISNPIRTPRGYHVIALRKAREITRDTLPPEDAMRNQIGMERLDRLQQRYLLDLKASAFIENRV